MVRLQIPQISYSRFDVTLSGDRFLFDFSFNSRDGDYGRWYLDIYNSDEELIVGSLKLLEDTSPTVHLDLSEFNLGFLQVTQLDDDELPASRNNLGVGKSYDLQYVTFSELGL